MAAGLQRGSATWRSLMWLPGCLVAVIVLGGCGGRTPPASSDDGAHLMTDAEYVEYVAALTVVLEERLSDDPAALRMEELGAPAFTRARVESFAVSLRNDTGRWLALTKRIDNRVAEIRKKAESSQP